MRCSRRFLMALPVFALVGLVSSIAVRSANAADYSMTSDRDNTLFQFDPSDLGATMNANGKGNFFGAGATKSRNQIQRGLVHFDFSGLPDGATVTPGTASLRLYVVDSPRKDPTPTRPFWLVRLAGLAEPWGEGDSLIDVGSGAGGGIVAELGDATWFYTQYDTAKGHDMMTFNPGIDGYWGAMGALGDAILDPWYTYGTPTGTAGQKGEFAMLSSDAMVDDLNAWLTDPAVNFGWIVLGDETVLAPDASTKRGFATREHATTNFRPLLTFEYTVVPEPGTLVVLGIATAGLLLWMRPMPMNDNPMPIRSSPADMSVRSPGSPAVIPMPRKDSALGSLLEDQHGHCDVACSCSDTFTDRPLLLNSSLSSRASHPTAAMTTSAGASTDFLIAVRLCSPWSVNNRQTSPATSPIPSFDKIRCGSRFELEVSFLLVDGADFFLAMVPCSS